ncbi:hypothetical protein JB92DRAFT_3109497 [Gautieria morchelliformis]|nr:hypothetical protein JB92DRAFT_3109497 [Gautieria morchelliformis]
MNLTRSAKQGGHCERNIFGNIFGGMANFDVSISYGSHTSDAFCAALSMPLSPSLHTMGRLSLYRTEHNLSHFSSCWEALKGARATISQQFISYEVLTKTKKDIYWTSSSDDGTDAEQIQFEHGTSEVEEALPPCSVKATDEEDICPRHYSMHRQKAQTSLVISVDSSSSEDR